SPAEARSGHRDLIDRHRRLAQQERARLAAALGYVDVEVRGLVAELRDVEAMATGRDLVLEGSLVVAGGPELESHDRHRGVFDRPRGRRVAPPAPAIQRRAPRPRGAPTRSGSRAGSRLATVGPPTCRISTTRTQRLSGLSSRARV